MITKQQQPVKSPLANTMKMSPSSQEQTTRGKTRIIIKYDIGFGNTLHIRGNGANLSWDKGIPLKNIKNDEWIWETEIPFSKAEFKVLINDKQYETGNNHIIHSGNMIQYTPKF